MANKSKLPDTPETKKDDALFASLSKKKKRRRRKILITVTSILLVLAIVAVVGVNLLKKRVREEFATTQGEVLSHQVTTGSISTVVSGSGSLSDDDLNAITVPTGVEITEVLVTANQSVSQGDILATVDAASVVSAMADLQQQITELDTQISDAEEDAASTSVTAGVAGRVKVIYGAADTDVTDIMYEHGALALLSLDGYMAVDIETSALVVGDAVTVVLSDGEEVSGTVSAVVRETASVLISDDGPEYEDAVTVLSSDGTQIGTGSLYIHTPLRVTGFAGTISDVDVEINDTVTEDTCLFTLEDTAYSANYHSLLRDRAELEDVLLQLLTMQQDGAVLSPIDGSVYSVDHTEEALTSVATLSEDKTMSVTINVDEADILSLELGQSVSVTVSSVSEDAFSGTLTEINRSSSSSGSYTAVVQVQKAEGMLSGMTASVSVQIEGVEDAILIPIEALHKTSDGAYVYTSYNEELQEYGGKVDVVTGLENSTYVEIKSGLSVGDTVYYTEQQSAFSGFGGGSMPGFGSGEMPDIGSGNMPNFGGGGMPNFGGGSGRPGGFGG